jgi:hypothetical protein
MSSELAFFVRHLFQRYHIGVVATDPHVPATGDLRAALFARARVSMVFMEVCGALPTGVYPIAKEMCRQRSLRISVDELYASKRHCGHCDDTWYWVSMLSASG